MTKWEIEIGEFDITFIPRIAIKGQAVIDFVAEFTYLTKVVEIKIDVLSTSEEDLMDDDPTNPNNV